MKKNHPFQLNKEQMRSYGYQVIDAIVDHYQNEKNKKPVSLATRREMDNLFLEEVPKKEHDFEDVLSSVLNDVMPKSNIPSHPKFYSFVPGPSNYVSVLADTLATGFNVFAGGWMGSPAAAEIEIITINWLLKIFKFPVKKGGGIFTSGGSMANLTALVTARRQLCGDDFSDAVIYISDQAHSSNIKAIRILGFKKEQVRVIPTDIEFKMAINKLKNAIAKDKLNGLRPFCIIASAGTTNTGTVDPLNEVALICKKEKIWFHVDGAYGGAVMLSSRGKKYLKGIEKADSITIDPHKWLYQPYEMGCLLVRDFRWLNKTFSEKPEYLKDIEGNTSEINFYDHGIQLTRRFRALKLYMSLKTFGLKTFEEAIDYNIRLAEETEEFLRNSSHWEIVSPATLAVINFRYNPVDKNYTEKELNLLNQKISEKITASGEAALVTTILNKMTVLRMCLINPKTTHEDIRETLRQGLEIAKDI